MVETAEDARFVGSELTVEHEVVLAPLERHGLDMVLGRAVGEEDHVFAAHAHRTAVVSCSERKHRSGCLADERFRARLEREVPARRIGDPGETAELALFLASGSSSFIYGQIISQDGGWS